MMWLAQCESKAAGTWTALASAPPIGVNHAMVLSDGSILTDNGDGNCCRLTPDSHGSYRNGTWTRLASMNYSRMFFASEMLTNGNVFVAGGEYGSGRRHAELFDPLNNVWTKIPDPLPGPAFSDAMGKILPDGNVLVAPVSQFGGCRIYNVADNNWQTAASTANQDETCWVKLANDSILTINTGSINTEHYVPSTDTWVADGNLPVPLYGNGAELGAGFLLPDGRVFYLGATPNTAIYTPGSSATSAGSWVASATIPNNLGAVDAPAAMMVNGKVLCVVGPTNGFNGPCSFYEYDYTANAFTQVGAPGGGSTYGSSAPFGTSLLDLPDGTVLFIGGQNSQSLYVYTPDGTPLAAGKPVVYGFAENTDGSYHLVGTGLNGISGGAAYGDDEQMDSDYPLVRMTNSVTGNVYYARTYNWSSTSVQTGGQIITTEFTLPQNLPAGTYSLVADANGNPSAARTFNYSPPGVPVGLAATGGNAFIKLTWNPSAGATAYDVKRSATTNGYFATIATVSSITSYTNSGLTNGLTYYYKVAAVGGSGPSSDSVAVSATPTGPSLIPGATIVNLLPDYNRAGIYTDGKTFSGGLDNGGSAFSANLLGPSIFWNNLVFDFGPPNNPDVVSCIGQSINLPPGRFNTLQILATGVDGSQTAKTFTVIYTDNSTATFTQSFSDWANQQSYPGETKLITMPYRNTSGGGSQALNVSVDGYVLALDQTKTVKSIILPNDSNLLLLAMTLANDPAGAALADYYNRAGIYTDGTTFTNPPTGGVDGNGYAYSGTLLGGSETWSNTVFNFGPANATNVISCAGQTIPLPAGNYSRLEILGAGVNGNQPSQPLVVTYSDASTATFSQGFSDWFGPQNYAGEFKAIPMGYRNSSDGSSSENSALYLYGYSLALNPAKTVQSIRLPNNGNVIIAAINVVPDWPPTFDASSYVLASANAGQSYSANIASHASDLNGDSLTFAKVSGPAWLNVAANGTIFGTPANSDANTNTFVVSVRDTAGLSNTASLYIYVNGAPSFRANPFTLPPIVAGQNESGTIATNATDPNPGDTLTFAKVSGPSWLSVATDGSVSGTPLSSNVGNNSFVVSVTDSGGLSNTATMNVTVNAAPAIASTISLQAGSLQLNWSGGVGPYQVQATTNLANPDWQDVGGTITSNSFSVTPTNGMMFYRIMGQ